MYKLGIDIGGTKMNIGLLDENNQIFAKEKQPICRAENLVSQTKLQIDAMLKKHNIGYGDIMSCGIGIPGTVSEDGRVVKKAPNLGLFDAYLADEFEEALGLPVKLIQDSRAAAWGEYTAGAGKGFNTLVCITLGTGIGTGIVINGEIYNGALGTAGELGHIPVSHEICGDFSARECGCGKSGCMEKYAAGGGLDLTAKELFGAECTSVDLFSRAEEGDERAKNAVNAATEMLGRAVVSIINLLSPDCILFSGGLSKQKELFVNPLMEYVKSHCYSTGDRSTYIGIAALGEDSPLAGAALIPNNAKRAKPIISASVMCADILHLADALKEIKDAGIEYLHCDIMDNHFVPNLMLPMELFNSLRSETDLPFDFHIMAENPETIIEKLTVRSSDIIAVHYESTYHLQRILGLVKEKGAIPAVAINPATPIEAVREVLDDIDMLLIMTVNPGFAGQKIVPQSFDKIKRARRYLDDLGYKSIKIEVDGNCSFENVPKMYQAGADILVAGTSSVFNPSISIAEGVKRLLLSVK